MWIFWIVAMLPIIACGVMVFLDRKVSYKEWIITTIVALAMAGLFQLCASLGMTHDIETWSGQVSHVQQYSAWTEYYEQAIYRTETYLAPVTHTDSKGNVSVGLELRTREVFDHWEPRQEEHPAQWRVFTTLGDWEVDAGWNGYLCKQFGGLSAFPGERVTGKHASRMIGGDPNDYASVNKTGWVEPVVTTKYFKNKVKAAPSVFSFPKVPTNVCVFPWPNANNAFRSGRVIGEATKTIDMLKWDQMNAQLGPTKKVNLIIIGFGEQDPKMAKWQEAAWIGGKKNDLVICYGTIKLEDEGASVKWAKVFGWTESNKVKRNLEKIVEHNPVNDSLLPLIAAEVKQNYVIKDWSEFDNLTVEPPTWCYWLYFGIVFLLQGGLFYFYRVDELDQTNDGTGGLLAHIGDGVALPLVKKVFGKDKV